jgi:hypothetical protein
VDHTAVDADWQAKIRRRYGNYLLDSEADVPSEGILDQASAVDPP